MSHPEPYAWLKPKLEAIVSEARQVGIGADIVVAVVTDLMNGPAFATAPLEVDEDWNRDIGEPDGAVNETGQLASDGSFDEGGGQSVGGSPGSKHLRSLHPRNVR